MRTGKSAGRQMDDEWIDSYAFISEKARRLRQSLVVATSQCREIQEETPDTVRGRRGGRGGGGAVVVELRQHRGRRGLGVRRAR